MKTFKRYLDEKFLENKIAECANILVENDISPDVFIKTWYDENEPQISLVLSESGFWNGLQQGANTVWQNTKAAAQQFGQGVTQGYQNFQKTAYGPMAQYQNAVKTLTGLVNYIQNTPQLSGNYSNVNAQIGKILNDLKALQPSIPYNQDGKWTSQTNPMAAKMNTGYFNNNQQVQPTPIPNSNFVGN